MFSIPEVSGGMSWAYCFGNTKFVTRQVIYQDLNVPPVQRRPPSLNSDGSIGLSMYHRTLLIRCRPQFTITVFNPSLQPRFPLC
jgi:hypothetical protein